MNRLLSPIVVTSLLGFAWTQEPPKAEEKKVDLKKEAEIGRAHV